MGFEIQTDSETPIETQALALPHEEVVAGDVAAKVSGENVTFGSRTARALKPSTLKLLGNQTPTSEIVADKVTPPEPAPAAAPASTAPAAVAAPDVAEPHADTVRANRLAEHNARLVAELAAARAKPTSDADGEHRKALDELESLIVTNPVAAHRRLMSRAMGVPEDSKDIDTHEQFLESELTSKRIGVPLTEDSEAARKAARTLVAIQREMRARKAEETKPAPAPEANADDTEAVSFIGNRVAALKHADKYQLLHAWGKHVDGQNPNKLVLNVMRHLVDIGELDRNEPVDQLIDKASQRLEDHYKNMAAMLPKPASTAPAAAPEDGKNAAPTGKTGGTISNAIASVAPSTLPAPKTPEPETYRTAREKRIAIIRKHTPA